MSFPTQRKAFNTDRFGPYQIELPQAAETQSQKQIEEAWKQVRNFVGLLNEYNEGIQRRGIWTDDAIRWYVKGYKKGDNLWEEIWRAYERLGERLRVLNEVMVETYGDRKLYVRQPRKTYGIWS